MSIKSAAAILARVSSFRFLTEPGMSLMLLFATVVMVQIMTAFSKCKLNAMAFWLRNSPNDSSFLLWNGNRSKLDTLQHGKEQMV